MVFIDFSKAFDSINRQAMFKIVAVYDIPVRIINAIILMYSDIKAKVVSPDGDIFWSNARRYSCNISFHHCTKLCNEASHTWKRARAKFYFKEEAKSQNTSNLLD